MQAGTAYSSGLLIPPPLLGLAFALTVETSFPDFTPIQWPYRTWLSPNWEFSMEHWRRMWHTSRVHLPLRTPGSVPLFGTCLWSNCLDQISRNRVSLPDLSHWIPSVLYRFCIVLNFENLIVFIIPGICFINQCIVGFFYLKITLPSFLLCDFTI